MQKEFKELCDEIGGVDKLLSILQVAADIEEGSDV
jgi:hypothetical protein